MIIAVGSGAFYKYGRSIWFPSYLKVKGKRTVEDVVKQFGPTAETRLMSKFGSANVNYPPSEVTFIAFKDKKILDVWAKSGDTKFRKVTTYNIKGASGHLGPKLREGDHQVPEGIYKIVGLNPNSSYHLSMKLNYPNNFDQKYAKLEGRTNPGTNIFIHGKSGSVGCLAMGDTAIEELFILSEKVGLNSITVIISPTKIFRQSNIDHLSQDKPSWVGELYEVIRLRLQEYYKYSASMPLNTEPLNLTLS